MGKSAVVLSMLTSCAPAASSSRPAPPPAPVLATVVHVLIESSRYVASGWVASTDLTTTQNGGIGYGVGRGAYGKYGKVMQQYPSCVHDLTLIGEIADERRIIGTIHAGSPYVLDSQPEAEDPRARKDPNGMLVVELPLGPLHLEKGARLLVRQNELETCRLCE